jgi:hypothetical protein
VTNEGYAGNDPVAGGERLGLSAFRMAGALLVVAGAAAVLGVYWDDAWHTDIGRDSAWIAPHLLLYGGVAVVGVVIGAWGVRNLARTRSLSGTVRYRPLLFSGIGAVAVLAAAPLDAMWHSLYGRDAVLWSPPHIVVVFASTTMVTALLAGFGRERSAVLDALLGGLLLGDLAISVMEYETDVPQFSDAYYLPVAIVGALLAMWFVRRLTGRRYAVTWTVLAYLGIRLVVLAVLALLGRSTPDLPVAYAGLLLMDLPWRSSVRRYAAGAAGMAVLAWSAAAVGVTSQRPAPLGVAALAAVTVLGVSIAAGPLFRKPGRRVSGRGRPSALAAWAGVTLAMGSILWPAHRAAAHDPGQGEVIRRVTDTVTTDADGNVAFAVDATGDCATLEPVRLVARRGGDQSAAPLRRSAGCRFESSIDLPRTGRWFVYAELRAAGELGETWLPVPVDQHTTRTERRPLYRPAGSPGTSTGEIVTGVAIYAGGLALLGLSIWQCRRRYGLEGLP